MVGLRLVPLHVARRADARRDVARTPVRGPRPEIRALARDRVGRLRVGDRVKSTDGFDAYGLVVDHVDLREAGAALSVDAFGLPPFSAIATAAASAGSGKPTEAASGWSWARVRFAIGSKRTTPRRSDPPRREAKDGEGDLRGSQAMPPPMGAERTSAARRSAVGFRVNSAGRTEDSAVPLLEVGVRRDASRRCVAGLADHGDLFASSHRALAGLRL